VPGLFNENFIKVAKRRIPKNTKASPIRWGSPAEASSSAVRRPARRGSRPVTTMTSGAERGGDHLRGSPGLDANSLNRCRPCRALPVKPSDSAERAV
jgi:hypothetical protein